MPPFVNFGRYVFLDPANGGEGQNLDAGCLVPFQIALTVAGEPIVELTHQHVIGKSMPGTGIRRASAVEPAAKGSAR